MLQLKDNPPSIWPADALDQLPLGAWVAAYCRPRQEKALAWDLYKKGVAYFLPMVLRETSSGGRRRRNLYPLFPSYLFIAGREEDRVAGLKTDRIVQIIR